MALSWIRRVCGPDGTSLYEDEILLYSVDHENRSYSTLEGDWYEIWQACVKGETDPDQFWRTRWDLMAYYYGTDFSGEGCGYISFTAYLVDQIGLQIIWDYFFVTENECPEIDFAKYRTEWENYLTETYGQYPQFSDYNE